MKTKLFGIALIVIGLICLGWIGLQIIVAKGIPAAFGCAILVAGWLIFNFADKAESPEQTKEKETPMEEVKSGFGRIRSFLKGLLQKIERAI